MSALLRLVRAGEASTRGRTLANSAADSSVRVAPWRLMICEATRAPARPMADTPCPRRYAHRTPAAYASPAPQVSIGALVVQCGGTTCKRPSAEMQEPSAPSVTTTMSACGPKASAAPFASQGSPTSAAASDLFVKMMSTPACNAAHSPLRLRMTQPMSPAVRAIKVPCAWATSMAAVILSAAPGISHTYPSITSMRARAMAVVRAGSSTTGAGVPRYDSMVRFASGVVSTITVPVQLAGLGRANTFTPARCIWLW
mmetsp:Transcript_18668/g.56426  ORF Transcript_18668/g.56426 Transcript_18668/m.56426 type:complete len:256 (+) Transcript_18668:382-1149(+)